MEYLVRASGDRRLCRRLRHLEVATEGGEFDFQGVLLCGGTGNFIVGRRPPASLLCEIHPERFHSRLETGNARLACRRLAFDGCQLGSQGDNFGGRLVRGRHRHLPLGLQRRQYSVPRLCFPTRLGQRLAQAPGLAISLRG